jgi:recombination protein RecR
MNLDPIERLIGELGRLPGIGQRTAARLAFYIIKMSRTQENAPLARDLAKALIDVADQVQLCDVCQNLCTAPTCSICQDPRREQSLLCVVEGVADLRAIEESAAYSGLYYVLHGAIAPLEGVGPHDLKLPQIVTRVQTQAIGEVILATNADIEGDATALYLAQILKPTGVRMTRIASGVPMGGELEYIDRATLGRALMQRRSMFARDD